KSIPVRKKPMQNFAETQVWTFCSDQRLGSCILRTGRLTWRKCRWRVGSRENRGPGSFRGVCTVVAKLFNILAPDAAVFGEKDFQQLAVVRRMVRDLNFKIDIIAVPTVREADGLACSSRNKYLTAEERKQAMILRNALLKGADMARTGETSAARIVSAVRETIGQAPLARIDYVDLVSAQTLQPIEVVRQNSLVAVAVFFGKTRLIDNILLACRNQVLL